MGAFSIAAINVVGRSREEFKCNQVVNQILFGKKDNGMLARDYRSWGIETSMRTEGVVVVGNNGEHVGIFINDHEFVHSSSFRKEVIIAPFEQLDKVFPGGYTLRKSY